MLIILLHTYPMILCHYVYSDADQSYTFIKKYRLFVVFII